MVNRNHGPCPDKLVPKHHHWPRMQNDLFAADWNLLLCSAGTLSAILCEHARQAGRKALDVGAFSEVLLGTAVDHDAALQYTD